MSRELEDPGIWNTPEKAQELGRERARLEDTVGTLDRLSTGITDAGELLELAIDENDTATIQGVEADVARLAEGVHRLEFQRMFPGEMDSHNAFLDIQAGAGGTEAQDWAAMLLRMYLKWGDAHGFKTEVIDQSDGEVAGIKSAIDQLRPATTPTAGCAPRPACTAWCASRRSTRAIAATPRSRPFSSRPRSMTTSTIEINPADLRDRRLPLERRGRPARQQDRVGRAHHASADGDRGGLPERAQPAQEPLDGDEDAEGASSTSSRSTSAMPRPRCSRIPSRT